MLIIWLAGRGANDWDHLGGIFGRSKDSHSQLCRKRTPRQNLPWNISTNTTYYLGYARNIMLRTPSARTSYCLQRLTQPKCCCRLNLMDQWWRKVFGFAKMDNCTRHTLKERSYCRLVSVHCKQLIVLPLNEAAGLQESSRRHNCWSFRVSARRDN